MPGISDYIRAELKKGFTKESIRAALLQVGHSEQQVDEAFRKVEITPAVADRFDPNQFFQRKYLIFSIVAILVIVLGVAGIFMILDQPGKQVNQTSVPQPNTVVVPTKLSQDYLDCMYSAKKRLSMCLAWVENDAAQCDGLVKDKEDCVAFSVMKQALSDSSLCSQLDDENRQLCLALIQRSAGSCSSSACKLFAGIRDAYEKHDSSVCSQLTGLDKSLCEGVIADNAQVCREKLTDRDCPAKYI